MGQEMDDTICWTKKKARIIIMLKKSKRALSLVLALMMICSTMGVMAFAQDVVDGLVCPNCFEFDCLYYVRYEEQFNRVIECPNHFGHDAEEWYVGAWYDCGCCNERVFVRSHIEYRCL